MSYVDTIRDSNEALLSQAQSAVDSASRNCPGLIRPALQQFVDHQAYGLGRLVPDGWVDEAADILIEGVQYVLDYCVQVIQAHRILNEYLGSPETLRAAADLLGDLASRAEAIQIDKSTLPGWMSWDDLPASNAYSGGIDAQLEPLSRVSTTASSIGSALDQHANDIENYYLQLAAIIVGAVTTILGVVGAILGIIAAVPTGGVSLAGSIVGLVAAVVGLVSMGIGIVQMFTAATQGTQSKLDSLPATITTWEAPPFAIVQ